MNSNSGPKADYRLVALWSVASIAGFVSAYTVWDLAPDGLFYPQYKFGLLSGSLNGVFQFLVLRRYRAGTAWWWIPASAIGYSLAFPPSEYVELDLLRQMTSQYYLQRWIGQLVFGGIVGASQWAVLRRLFPRAGWWVLISAVGLGTADVLTKAAIRLSGVPVYPAVVLLGILAGMSTGAGLVWLSNQRAAAIDD